MIFPLIIQMNLYNHPLNEILNDFTKIKGAIISNVWSLSVINVSKL